MKRQGKNSLTLGHLLVSSLRINLFIKNTVIEHSRQTSTSSIDLSQIRRTDLFTNSKIERQASIELVEAVFSQLVQKGNAMWKDKSKSKCLLSPHSFSSLAAALYNWAQMSGNINQVCTVFELSQGEDISQFLFVI